MLVHGAESAGQQSLTSHGEQVSRRRVMEGDQAREERRHDEDEHRVRAPFPEVRGC